jgi:hypothetical protein
MQQTETLRMRGDETLKWRTGNSINLQYITWHEADTPSIVRVLVCTTIGFTILMKYVPMYKQVKGGSQM